MEKSIKYIECINNCFSESAIIAFLAIIVALLMPMVFFIIGNKDELYSFDKKIILNRIFLYKPLIIFLLNFSLLLILKNILFIAVIFSIPLFVLAYIILFRSYKWLSSNESATNKLTYRQQHRVDYLKKIKTNSEIVEVWNIIFFDEKLLEKNQEGFIEAYIDTLNRYRTELLNNNQNNRHIYSYLLSMLNQNIDKINFSDINNYELLLNNSIKNYYSNRKGILQLYNRLEQELFLSLLKYALRGENHLVYLFFENINNYSKQPDVNPKDFIPVFYKDLFYLLEKEENIYYDELWHIDFLKSIIITKESYQGETIENLFLRYREYLIRKINTRHNLSKPEKDCIENITSNLLPNIDPIFWFDILTFVLWAFGVNDDSESPTHARIINWCSTKRNYGNMGRFYIGYEKEMCENYDMKQNIEKVETVFFLNLIFGNYFTKIKIEEVLTEIAKIKTEKIFAENSSELGKLNRLEYNFKIINE